MKLHLPVAIWVTAFVLSCGGNTPEQTMPGAEICDNGKDDNADGKTDCADPKCFTNAKCVGNTERCDNGIDDDGNGQTDCADASCEGADCGMGCQCAGGIRTESDCGDHLDNDGDNLSDCADPDCTSRPACSGAGG